jgi:membrane protease YdiL (CAAX protease family)
MKIELSLQSSAISASGLSETSDSLVHRILLFAVALAFSLAIFLFGANYYPLFSTNGNLIFVGSLTGLFLVTSLWLKRSPRYAKFWPVCYAFFVASAVNLISIYFAGNFSDIVKMFGVTDPNMIYGLDKVYDTLILVVPAIILIRVAGFDLKSIYLARGNQNWKWGIGIGSLVVVNFFTSVLIFFGTGYEASMLGPAVLWGIIFAFSNSLLEEVWIRGLFLKRYIPLIGVTGAVLLTSITFATMHFLSVAFFPATVVLIFVVNTFALGLACGILMVKTDSVWGAYLIHAAADLFLFIATLAAR